MPNDGADDPPVFLRQSYCRFNVGGGASALVGDLPDRGYRHVTVLDLSA